MAVLIARRVIDGSNQNQVESMGGGVPIIQSASRLLGWGVPVKAFAMSNKLASSKTAKVPPEELFAKAKPPLKLAKELLARVGTIGVAKHC